MSGELSFIPGLQMQELILAMEFQSQQKLPSRSHKSQGKAKAFPWISHLECGHPPPGEELLQSNFPVENRELMGFRGRGMRGWM